MLTKKSIAILLSFFFLVQVGAQKLDHVLGEVIVEVRNERGIQDLMQDLSKDIKVRSSLQARQIMTDPMNLWVVKINPNEVNELNFLRDIKMNYNTLLAQQNHITQLRETIPDDPGFADQWQYINMGQSGGVIGADIDMDLAWDFTTGGVTTDGDSIVVCVIDDGINPNHPDLGDNLWINRQEIPDNGIDDDENGYVDDVRGWDAYADNDNVYQGGGHGTPVAGIVGAQGNNGVGVAGVNWDVKLMIVRGGSPESTALASYAYPYTMRRLYNETNGEKGAFVVSTNASWGIDFGNPEDAPIWCDFYNTLGEVGILNFGATINGNTNVDEQGDLPTGCESNYLVSVTNMNRNDEKVTGAGFGLRTIDLGAFGAQTYTLTSGGYGGFGGTSGATPHVAGTAALLYSSDCADFTALAKANPAQAALVVKDCILHGVDPNASLQGITTTGGRLNTHKAIQNLVTACGDCTFALGSDVGEITDVKGQLTWYDNGKIGTTSIRYKALDEEEWTEVENVSSGFEFEGLIACTAYEYQTRTICETNPDAEYTYSRVFDTDGCCEAPEGVSVSLDGQVATIEWGEVLAASNFLVEWRNIKDDVWTMVDAGLNNTFVIENIADCEFYEIRIKSLCANTNNESEFTEILRVNGECGACTREFCTFEEKNVSDEWIESVAIENVFSNVSGVSETGYGDFLGQFEINLTTGEEYTIQLAPGYSGNMFDEFFSAFIDFNQNGAFEDNEIIYESMESTQEAVSGTFTVPSDAVPGISRMRIVMRFNSLNGPCDNFGFEYGEIEDYCVNIEEGVGCPSAVGASIVDSMLTSITFEFNPNNAIESYMLLYKPVEVQDYDTVYSTSSLVVLDSLEECSRYNYRLGFVCLGESKVDTLVNEAWTLCKVSSIEEENLAFNIYPNPSYDHLIVDLGEVAQQQGTIEIISGNGMKTHHRKAFDTGSTIVMIDANELPSGIYFIKTNYKDQTSIQKWIKL